jgi:hypothetical protein
LKYEPGVIVADGDFVIVLGRFSGFGAPAKWIAAEILVVKQNPHGVLGYLFCSQRGLKIGAHDPLHTANARVAH